MFLQYATVEGKAHIEFLGVGHSGMGISAGGQRRLLGFKGTAELCKGEPVRQSEEGHTEQGGVGSSDGDVHERKTDRFKLLLN